MCDLYSLHKILTHLEPVDRRPADTGRHPRHLIQRTCGSHVRHEGSDAEFGRGGRRIDAVQSQNLVDCSYVTVVDERQESLVYIVDVFPVVQRLRHQVDVASLIGTACKLSRMALTALGLVCSKNKKATSKNHSCSQTSHEINTSMLQFILFQF